MAIENDNIFDILTSRGIEAFGRFYSIYRAIVVDNEDPSSMNKVQVVVPQISNEPIWAYPKGMDGSSKSGFKWLTPKKGQVVWVEFQMGDFLYPTWDYHGWAKGEIPDELNDNDVLGFVTPHGHIVTLNDTKGLLTINISDPQEDKILTSLIVNKGNVSLESTEEVSLKAKKIKLMKGKIGITQTDNLLKKINKLEDEINNLKLSYQSVNPILVGLVPTWASVTKWSATPITKTTLNDIENKDILQ